MSDTASDRPTYVFASPGLPPAAPVAASTEPLISFAAFAATLHPRRVPLVRAGRPVVRAGTVVMTVAPGHPDEIWLRLLKVRHGTERHAVAAWSALIDEMRDEPAHPTVAGVK
jgi:hypothetical protein